MNLFLMLFVTTCVLVLAAIIMLGIKVITKKNGRFPESSVSKNDAMKAKGITCVHSFDRNEQSKGHKNYLNVKPDTRKPVRN